jgi:hypothetical protein
MLADSTQHGVAPHRSVLLVVCRDEDLVTPFLHSVRFEALTRDMMEENIDHDSLTHSRPGSIHSSLCVPMSFVLGAMRARRAVWSSQNHATQLVMQGLSYYRA